MATYQLISDYWSGDEENIIAGGKVYRTYSEAEVAFERMSALYPNAVWDILANSPTQGYSQK